MNGNVVYCHTRLIPIHIFNVNDTETQTCMNTLYIPLNCNQSLFSSVSFHQMLISIFSITGVFQVAKTRPFLHTASQTVLPLSTVMSRRHTIRRYIRMFSVTTMSFFDGNKFQVNCRVDRYLC